MQVRMSWSCRQILLPPLVVFLQTAMLWPIQVPQPFFACLEGLGGCSIWYCPCGFTPIHVDFRVFPIDKADTQRTLERWYHIIPNHASPSVELQLRLIRWLVRPHESELHTPTEWSLIQFYGHLIIGKSLGDLGEFRLIPISLFPSGPSAANRSSSLPGSIEKNSVEVGTANCFYISKSFSAATHHALL